MIVVKFVNQIGMQSPKKTQPSTILTEVGEYIKVREVEEKVEAEREKKEAMGQEEKAEAGEMSW